jgi:hypothetical protein
VQVHRQRRSRSNSSIALGVITGAGERWMGVRLVDMAGASDAAKVD